jgi:hypothetical protein
MAIEPTRSAFLKAVNGVSGGIVDKDIQLHGTRGRFQNEGSAGCVRRLLRGGSQNGNKKKCGNRGPAAHLLQL